jgi:hypothetical protein
MAKLFEKHEEIEAETKAGCVGFLWQKMQWVAG